MTWAGKLPNGEVQAFVEGRPRLLSGACGPVRPHALLFLCQNVPPPIPENDLAQACCETCVSFAMPQTGASGREDSNRFSAPRQE
ncbi:hypothetical protein CSUI_009701 [Cystoisospora suis]|uniref:Uncharacterized protein n=1 Tax=Cystoisospora suis TaxID=483139 RepID=A0A2C6KJ94_9APIC|nr:hypothetical protein CSUI_009701 [Cystoisospora suis]